MPDPCSRQTCRQRMIDICPPIFSLTFTRWQYWVGVLSSSISQDLILAETLHTTFTHAASILCCQTLSLFSCVYAFTVCFVTVSHTAATHPDQASKPTKLGLPHLIIPLLRNLPFSLPAHFTVSAVSFPSLPVPSSISFNVLLIPPQSSIFSVQVYEGIACACWKLLHFAYVRPLRRHYWIPHPRNSHQLPRKVRARTHTHIYRPSCLAYALKPAPPLESSNLFSSQLLSWSMFTGVRSNPPIFRHPKWTLTVHCQWVVIMTRDQGTGSNINRLPLSLTQTQTETC